MNSNKRVGVVGVGKMGTYHAKHYTNLPGVQLTGVVDIDPNRAWSVGKACGCDFFDDPTDLIGLVDGVSIAVPSVAHREIAELFISNGVDVLIEKPLASTVDDAKHIIEAARLNGVKLLVGHQERFNSAILALAERLDSPTYFEIYRLNMFAGRGGDVDVVTDLMIHDIDLILALLNSPVASVSAFGASVVTPFVDVATARVEFENGVAANITASRVCENPVRSFEAHSNSNFLRLDLINQTLTDVKTNSGAQISGHPFSISEHIYVEPNNTLRSELMHFIDILWNEDQPRITGEDGLAALQVAQMVSESIR